ncbi:hypothetical protein INR49_028916 [Caranx melampygus]|nr:hypothetical protein INR49_028916 [Caranx melampygus]
MSQRNPAEVMSPEPYAMFVLSQKACLESDPDLIVHLQLQHQALTLHDGAVTRLGVYDGLLFVVLHDV